MTRLQRPRLQRLVAALATSIALLGTSLVVAAPASALSPVTYTVKAPSKTWVGDWVNLGLQCSSTCPQGVLDATVTISGGPTLDLPAQPDYDTDWQVRSVASGTDDSPVLHTVTVTFTDETGSPRTLSKQMQVNRDSPQYVENLTGNDGMDATVTWDPPSIDGGSAITGYNVQVDEDPWIRLSAAARSFSLAGLTYGPHEVRVIAVNAVGWGWGDPVTVLRGVLPSAPVVTVTGTAHPTVTWTESVGGGVSVTGYTVYSGGVPLVTTSSTARSATLSSLDPGAQDLQVAANCVWGPGDFSAAVEWVQATVPSAVSTPTVTPGNGRLTVSWEVPSDDGGMPVTSYKVRVIDVATSTLLATATTSGTSVDVTGLLNGFPVLATVAAVNDLGTSGWTDAASSVAPNGPAPLATTLSLRASDTTPTASQRVVLAGTLAVPGKSETGQKVQIWLKPYGSTTWTRAATLTLGSSGAWTYSRYFKVRTTVQVRYLGSVALNARQVNSSALTVSPAVTVTARTTTSSYTPRTTFGLGATVWVPVSTAGAPSGATAKLQRKSGSSWITVASAALSAGKAKLRWKPTARGTYYLRVAVTGSTTVRTGLSSTLTTRVT